MLLQDLRYAARVSLKQPAFTAIAVLTLALGIGANTAIFSIVNAVLLRPLPYRDAGNLVAVYEKRAALGRQRNDVSPPEFIDWRAQNTVFENIAAYVAWSANETSGDEPQRVVATLASADLFAVLGVQPSLGRAFTSNEDKPNAEHVVVLSHGYWQSRFNADPSVLGKPLTLNGANYTVVGVMPQSFDFPDKDTQLWAPLAIDPARTDNRGQHSLSVVARLKPGITLQQARAEMERLAATLAQQYPVSTGHSVNLFPLQADITGPLRAPLLVLVAAVAFVLLIACVNVANLLLVRLTARQREIAIRSALGASRARLVRQFFCESLLLSFVGGACGLLLAVWGTDVLLAVAPANTPRLHEIRTDVTVLLFAFGVSLLPGLLFGLLPALQTRDVTSGLKQGGRAASPDAGTNRLRNALVVCEVASALVLLIGAGLLLKSFVRLRETNSGLIPSGVLTAQLTLPRAKYPGAEEQAAFTRDVIERLQATPGVISASAIASLPIGQRTASRYFGIEGRPPTRPGEGANAHYNVCAPDYFQTVGIPLLRGRSFTWRDVIGAPEVAVVNEAFARKFFPDEDAIGKRIQIGNAGWRTIIGIVGNVRQSGLHIEPAPEMYHSLLQDGLPFMALVVRTARDPQAFAADLRNAVHAIDRNQAVYDVKTMQEVVSGSLASRRLTMVLLGAFAGLAIALAAIGIYGVISYMVAQRTHEIGIRMALGAQTADVLRLVVGHGVTLTAIGIAAGVLASLGLTRLLASLLFSVSSTDPATFISVSLLLAAIAFLAGFIPGRRATRVDPVIALRVE